MSINPLSTKDPNDARTGRARLTARNYVFFLMIAAGLVLGVVFAITLALSEDRILALSRERAWLAVAAFIVLAAWLQIRFYRFVDEVEVKDNLWANTFGLHCALTGGVAWAFLARLGYAPPPNGWLALAAPLLVSALAYTVLKIRRFF